MEIFSDHAYFLNAVPKEFLKAEVEQVTCKDLELVAGIKRQANVIPGGQYWESYSELKPGHFRSANLHSIRTDLLDKGISPKVSLNGMGNVKRLKYGECMIHNWPAEAHVCMSFLEELSLIKSHNLVYRGESLAAFTMSVFDDFCYIKARPSLGFNLRNRIAESQKCVCEVEKLFYRVVKIPV